MHCGELDFGILLFVKADKLDNNEGKHLCAWIEAMWSVTARLT